MSDENKKTEIGSNTDVLKKDSSEANSSADKFADTSKLTEDINVDTAVPSNTPNTVGDSVEQAAQPSTFSMKPYLVAGLVIVVMGLVLLFALEQQGRVGTNFFGGDSATLSGPAATVNGVAVSRSDFDRNYEQVIREVQMQGFDGQLNPEIEANLREQAVQSLVNAELLKQAADASGVIASAEAIEARMSEIEASNGGAEELSARMTEFGITMDQLRIDIEREILIQTYLNSVLDLDSVVVSDEELEEAYVQILSANEGAEVPPLDEIRDLLSDQLLNDKQQQVVGEHIETLRASADIVINV